MNHEPHYEIENMVPSHKKEEREKDNMIPSKKDNHTFWTRGFLCRFYNYIMLPQNILPAKDRESGFEKHQYRNKFPPQV